MGRRNFITSILIFVLAIVSTNMKAQEKTVDSLTLQQQSLISISSQTASGNIEQLKVQLNEGLNTGLTINEIKEALVQLYAYCGFPKSLNAINTFKTVLDERKAKGIVDKEGREIIVPIPSAENYEKGRKTLETLTKIPQAKPAPGFGEFAPRIDVFLKEHLFADIFSSDVLSYQQRELVTIAALATMPGVEGQLQSHINMGKNTGVTENQLIAIATLIEKNSTRTQANTVRKIIGQPVLPIIEEDMMIRISEIEIVPEFLKEYQAILTEEAKISVKIEPGVLAIFPMVQKENPNQIRIIEIYANKAAYQSHLTTPHFQHYKTSTLKMVKALQLIDMSSLDSGMMAEIFKKLN